MRKIDAGKECQCLGDTLKEPESGLMNKDLLHMGHANLFEPLLHRR